VQEAPRLDGRRLERRPRRPLSPERLGQGQARRGHRADEEDSGTPRGLPRRHPPRIRHGSLRVRHVVAAFRRPSGGRLPVGVVRQGLARRRDGPAEVEGRRVPRRRLRRAARPLQSAARSGRVLYLERHHLGRQGSRRRLDLARPHRVDLVRRHLGRLRDGRALGPHRRLHVQLAEGLGLGGRARRARLVPAARWSAWSRRSRRGRCPRCSD